MAAYMMEEFRCEAHVLFRGKRLQLNQIVAQVDLEEMLPPRGPVDMISWGDVEKRAERRRRFIDYLAGHFAHTLTEGLFKVGS